MSLEQIRPALMAARLGIKVELSSVAEELAALKASLETADPAERAREAPRLARELGALTTTIARLQQAVALRIALLRSGLRDERESSGNRP